MEKEMRPGGFEIKNYLESEDASLNKLNKFIDLHGIRLKRLVFDNPVADSASSAQEANVDISSIVKTVLFKDEQDHIYAIVVRATRNVDRKVIKKIHRAKDLRLIPRDEVVNDIGYPAGGVPPFGFEAIFIVDTDLGDDEVVYAGGGTKNSLIEIQISEILRVTQSVRASASKEE